MRPAAALALLAAVPLGAEGPELLEPHLVRQMEAVEAVVDREFRSADGSRPSAISAARAIFLPGYGSVFLVEVNLAPAANASPFRRSYTAREIREINLRKRAALEPLRRRMRRILLSEGPSLTHLAPDLQVALAVTLFHFPWEDRTGLPSQVVVSSVRGRLGPETALTTRHY